MLTVKCVSHRGTQEQVFLATSVALRLHAEKDHTVVVECERPGAVPMELGGEGVVYVMNDTGATVAKYDLYELNRRRQGVEYPPPPNETPEDSFVGKLAASGVRGGAKY
jgi:predicted alpha/beta-hydrolase family hydrolase